MSQREPLKPLQPGNGAFKRKPELAVYCRFCSFSMRASGTTELSAQTLQHLHAAHPELAAQFHELTLIAQVAGDRCGEFLDNMYATIPPPEYAEQFRLITETTAEQRRLNNNQLEELMKAKGIKKEAANVEKDRPTPPKGAGDVPSPDR